MKIIIDPYRGGMDTGATINGKLEKNIILDLSKYFSNKLKSNNIDAILTRNGDDNLTDRERLDIINNLSNEGDLIIQNRINANDGLNIIYPLSYDDKLESIISSNLSKNGFNVNKYYQRRLPTDTMYDYYSVIKDTRPNETIIIEYNDLNTINDQIDIIVDSILEYLSLSNTYKVVPGDTLYGIAKKFNTSVNELKKLNNLTGNNLNVGQILVIPNIVSSSDNSTYKVVSGDTLYSIAKKFNMTVDELKKLNVLNSNNLSIGQILKVKTSGTKEEDYINYKVVPGDTLYGISRKYNISMDDIKMINNLTSNILTVGSILKIPIVVTNYINYKVVSGDTLYSIAKKFNTSVDEIKKINGLESNILTIGNIINVPS